MMKTHFTQQSIIDLDNLIWDAQEKFLSIVEYSQLWKPKNHFVQHIPADILLYGPPRNFWCMRFEAKNQEHKRSAKLGDFKGVSKTVSEFWAMRSGLRLLGKRKRGSPELDANTDGTVTHNGMELSRGTWILLQDGASQIIARIDSFRAIHGVMYANLNSFKVLSIMRRCENDMPYASVKALSNSGTGLCGH
jgi:hypothetical protein